MGFLPIFDDVLGLVSVLAFPMIRPMSIFEWCRKLTISGSSLWSDLERLPGEEKFCFRSDDSNSLLCLGGEQVESYSLLPKDDEE